MEVQFVKHPPNDILPPRDETMGKSVIFEMSEPFLPEKPNSRFWLRCHECGLSANLANHDVNITDGKVTLSPSVKCPNTECPAHYFIKNGKVV